MSQKRWRVCGQSAVWPPGTPPPTPYGTITSPAPACPADTTRSAQPPAHGRPGSFLHACAGVIAGKVQPGRRPGYKASESAWWIQVIVVAGSIMGALPSPKELDQYF